MINSMASRYSIKHQGERAINKDLSTLYSFSFVQALPNQPNQGTFGSSTVQGAAQVGNGTTKMPNKPSSSPPLPSSSQPLFYTGATSSSSSSSQPPNIADIKRFKSPAKKLRPWMF
ncbi:hypothetical protein L3X38_023387 [Prunus dulcis]|uniref:Uncharacterized protein n=1 Tax=Prunus dulcis TaxID=3755 RepID=A0AAD4W0I5_PRUDU|nr:hypothetical protein L3X38_023387 [Prunus dulcis]